MHVYMGNKSVQCRSLQQLGSDTQSDPACGADALLGQPGWPGQAVVSLTTALGLPCCLLSPLYAWRQPSYHSLQQYESQKNVV